MDMTRRLRSAVLTAATLAVLLTGCGDPPAEQPGDGAMLPPDQTPTQTALDVAVDNGETTVSFRVICDDAPRFEGDAGDRDAKAACDAIAAHKDRLLLLSDPNREPEMCTEQYGGPDKATLRGTVEGEQVNAAVDRANGCGISDWTALEPLLGAPTGKLE